MSFLAWRDIKVRYRQAVLGAGWAIIQPTLQMILLTFVFSKLAAMPGSSVPYAVMVLTGILPWQFFASAFSTSSASLSGNANLLTKVYFPRMVVPLSAVAVAAVDLLLMLALTIPVCLHYGNAPLWQMLFLPLFIAAAGLLAIGAGLWCSALSIRHRDLRFLIPFVLQLGMFATPVGYRSDMLGQWSWVIAINPLTAVIEGFRWCLLGGEFSINFEQQLISLGWLGALLCTGIWLFRRAELHLADNL